MLEYLKKGEEYYVFVNDDSLLGEKNIINFFYQHHKKRVEKKIKVKLLFPSKIKDILKKNYEYKYLQLKEYKYIDQKLPLGTYVFKDHVMTVMWSDNPTVFVIKSKKNYQYYKDFFEDVWKRT